jgi:hypothetical protein
MNNTHYALINEDNDVVAVIRKEDFKGRVIKAIEDETGDELLRIDIRQIDYNTYKVQDKMSNDGLKYTATLIPTWEY